MKKFAIALLLSAIAVPATANEITSIITDSVSLTVQGPAVQTTRLGANYSVSGSNITATTLGGLGNSATSRISPAPPSRVTITDGTYGVKNDGQAFSFSESARTADIAATEQDTLSNNGRVDTPHLYGESTTQMGGSAGTLAGSLSATGISTVTAGGPGTIAVGQRTVEMSVFQ